MEQHKNNKKISPKCKRKNSDIPQPENSGWRDKESTPTEEGERGKRGWWSEMRSGGRRERRETTKKRKPREEKVERRQKVVERLGGVGDLGGVGTYPSGVFYGFVKINEKRKKKSQTT